MTQTAITTSQQEAIQPAQVGQAHEVLAAGVTPPDHAMMAVPLERIRRNQDVDPRQHRNRTRLATMLESFRADGILQPIVIRPVDPDSNGGADFEVVAGNTRFDGAVEVGHSTIPSVIRHISKREAVVLAGIENMQRQDLSPIEEGKHAAKLLAAQGNDHQEVCRLLDWSEAKLKSRIMLTHVNPFVQDALVQGDLKIGHVELLSGIPKNQQDHIAGKIIERGMSVTEAKDGLAKGTRQLAKACFDLTDCQGCRYNSSSVIDMFASADASRKDFCSNATCWDEKTKAKLQVIVTDAQEEYGTVLRENEVPADGYVALEVHGENGVGEDQKSACASCQHYGCIISTTFGNEGEARGEQCFNLECHAEKVTVYRAAVSQASGSASQGAQAPAATEQTEQTEQAGQPQTEHDSQTAAASAGGEESQRQEKSKPAPLTPATLKKGIKQEAMARFVKMGEEAIAGSERLGVAIALLSLSASLANFVSSEVKERSDDLILRLVTDAEALPPINAGVADNKALLLARLPIEELIAATTSIASLTVWRTDSSDQLENHAPHQNAARYAEARKVDRSSYLAVTPEYLKAQVKAGVIEDCKKSGFVEAYDLEKGEKAFLALSKGKAGDLSKEILAFSEAGGFDWHGYEPIGFTPSFYFDGI